jgi:hypothetical protein
MNEEAVSLWIRCAESDLKIGKGELATEDPATAVEVRYDTLIFPSVEETKHAVALAEQVRDFVRAKLSEKGYEGGS